jgi:RND family efflux transporter MFP subunit
MTEHDQEKKPEDEYLGPPRGVRAMALFRWMLIAAMAAIASFSVAYSFGLISAGSASAAETQYYCPMHPQVVQDHPGDCPICSMSLVPKENASKKSGSKESSSTGKSAVSHEGHRHNPADPYFCPMHPEETGADETARCPLCKMKLEKRAAGGAGASPTASSAASGPHEGHRHNPSDPYFCPMHPEETGADASARCPICEMKLEKREPAMQGAPGQAPSGATQPMPAPTSSTTGSPPPQPQGVPGLVPVELSMDRVQLIGIRTAKATDEALVPELRTVGFITADESKLARVHARFAGWIERMAVATTGQKVRRGQVLAGIYNLELLPAQQEFLAAQRWGSATGTAGATAASVPQAGRLAEDARSRLELFGLSRGEIDAVAKSGKPVRTVAVTAPIAGYVVRKNAVQGSFIQPGTELFEIADLSKVWALADIYEYEIGRVSVGQDATVLVSAYPKEPFAGKVQFIYPTVDSSTRTLRVRVELDNKDLKLRPGMYGDVTIQLVGARGVVVPLEALVDTGEHQYVFVAKEGGRFEPRQVRAGARSGDKVQILDGLRAGETVVTTSNFLIDSESRLRAAIQGTTAPGASPAEPAAASACDADFDKAKFPQKHEQCLQCERVHRGMGTMEEDCKKAIPRPWR